jgi:hypothetical protein
VPSASTLFVGIIAGVIGMSYCIYGKRQERIAFLAAGVGLCVYPYLLRFLCVPLCALCDSVVVLAATLGRRLPTHLMEYRLTRIQFLGLSNRQVIART